MSEGRRALKNPRDERGWLVPKEGSKSRLVYDLTLAGKGPKAIGDDLGLKRNLVNQMIWQFRHPNERNNKPETA